MHPRRCFRPWTQATISEEAEQGAAARDHSLGARSAPSPVDSTVHATVVAPLLVVEGPEAHPTPVGLSTALWSVEVRTAQMAPAGLPAARVWPRGGRGRYHNPLSSASVCRYPLAS